MKPTPTLSKVPATAWNYLVIAALLLPSLVWISRDHSVWPWDQAWYGEVSTDLWFWFGHSLAPWAREMVDGLPTKAPGIVWLGQFFVPLQGIFGSIETALLFSILLTQFIILAILFKIAQRMAPHSRLVPWAAVLFASASQLFVGLSHQFFVEPLQALAVAWCFYIAVRSSDWTKPRIALHLASALILGALAKATTPLYCLAPCTYAGYQLVGKPSPWNFAAELEFRSSRVLAFLLAPLGILCGFWYIWNLGSIWQHVRDASSGDIALNYGARDSVFHKLIIWSQLLRTSFLSPYLYWGALAAIPIVGGFAVYQRFKPSPERHLQIQPVAVLGMIQAGLLLSVFSLNITVDSRYMYALLPCVVIVLMQLCVLLPPAALIGLLALGSTQWFVVNRISFDLTGHLVDQSNWLLPIQTSDSQYDELSRVVRLTSDVAERYNVVGVEEPSMNANSAAFFVAKQRLTTGTRCYYTSLGYAEKDVDTAMRRIETLQTRYLITLAEPYQSTEPDFVNVVSLPVLERVRRDSRFRQCAFPSKIGLVVFQFAPAADSAGMRPTGPCEAMKDPPSGN